MKKSYLMLFLISCTQQDFSGKTTLKNTPSSKSPLETDQALQTSPLDSSQTVYGKDGSGNPIIGLDPLFKTPIIGKDDKGNPILGKGGLDKNGEPILGKTEDGKIIIGYNDKDEAIIDIIDPLTQTSIKGIIPNGKVITSSSQNHEKTYGVDATGKEIIGYDPKVQKPIIGILSDGSFVYGKGGLDDSGKPILGTTLDGKTIIGYTKDNLPIVDIKNSITGQTISGVDPKGIVITGTSENSSLNSSSSQNSSLISTTSVQDLGNGFFQSCQAQLSYNPSNVQCQIPVKSAASVWHHVDIWKDHAKDFPNNNAYWISPLLGTKDPNNHDLCPFVPQSDKLFYVSKLIITQSGIVNVNAIIDDVGSIFLWKEGDPTKQVFQTPQNLTFSGKVYLDEGSYSIVVEAIDVAQVATGMVISFATPTGKILKQSQLDNSWCIFRVASNTIASEFLPKVAHCLSCFK